MTDSQFGTPARVLIIDDDATTLQFFAQMLTERGHIVRTVVSVEAGLVEAARQAPDAVFLDFHIPFAGGLDCLRKLRAAPLNLTMPVAILTGDYFIDDDVAQELRELGARIHYKPLWEADLHRILAELVSRPPVGGWNTSAAPGDTGAMPA